MAAAAAARTFRKGTKQVYLPDHCITLLRPPEKQPATFATFRVPLTFNKLDMRDYLLHAYSVPTLGVRSQLTQRRPERSKVHHRIYRPPPIKTMTVELLQPFAWPAEPDDKSAWNPPHLERRKRESEKQEKWQKDAQTKGTFPLRDEIGATPARKELRREAQRLLTVGRWENEKTLDPKFSKDKKSRREK